MSAEIAGALVNPMGMTRKMTSRVAGQVVGGAAGLSRSDCGPAAPTTVSPTFPSSVASAT